MQNTVSKKELKELARKARELNAVIHTRNLYASHPSVTYRIRCIRAHVHNGALYVENLNTGELMDCADYTFSNANGYPVKISEL